MSMLKHVKERGTFDEACNRAAHYANRRAQNRNESGYAALMSAEHFLNRAGWGHVTFGIEHESVGDRELAYLNTGDTYSLTLAQEGEDGEVFSTSCGDWYEQAEQEYCEQEGAIRCGYCGEFTPCAEAWEETVCEHCGRNVSTGEKPKQAIQK
ncbi:MAG: hypothetical protein WC551_09410 [Patescibacteria group bacterium]